MKTLRIEGKYVPHQGQRERERRMKRLATNRWRDTLVYIKTLEIPNAPFQSGADIAAMAKELEP